MEHGIQRTGTCPTGYVKLCRQGWLLRGAPQRHVAGPIN